MNREVMLQKVRTALGRKPGEAPGSPPPVYFSRTDRTVEQRIVAFTGALEALSGHVVRCYSREAARDTVNAMIAGKHAIASRSSFLHELQIAAEVPEAASYREACASAEFGITSADYALADTGTLVVLCGAEESRLVSLLPPKHIAVLTLSRLIDSLDDLLARVPRAADITSSMVLITGPSRTADIEQILVRGVHGPGEITVVLVDA